MRTAAPRALIVLGIATILGLFSALLSYSSQLANRPMTWWLPFVLNGAYWFSWAAMSPFVFWMARRYRFEKSTIWRPLMAHLAAAALTSLVHLMMMATVRGLLRDDGLAWGWWLSEVQRSYWIYVDWEMVTYWAIVGTIHAFHFQAVVRQREMAAAHLETRLAEARLQSLQRQMHPHFLFNTLHSISALMHKDVMSADRMLALLGDLLRSSLRVTAQEISLKDELELLGKYLAIEQVRFQDRLTVSYDIPAETLDACVPSLILQPLVENALDHGIAPNSGRGRLDVRALRRGDQLWLEVRDDGVGLREDTLTVMQKGIGVSNTRSRLQCLYGAAHQFEFCRIGPRGLTVRLVIPWREAPEPAVALMEWVS